MTHTIFWRLVWKEYRLQRALWLAMAVLTGMLMLLVHALVIGESERVGAVFAIATMLPAFYCLGCGAILFAGEREAEVFEFHRSLPVKARLVFAAKITFALVSSVALFGAMWLASYALCGGVFAVRGGDPSAYIMFVLGLCVFGMELLFWSVFFSLLLDRVILAAVLGVVGASIHLELLSNLGNIAQGQFGTLPWAAALTTAVIAADVWLGVRWFREKRERRSTFAPFAGNSVSPTQSSAFSARFRRPARLAILGRLLWQHWRQSGWTMIVIIVILTLLAEFPSQRLVVPNAGLYDYGDFAIRPLFLFALAGVPAIGACAFLADQRRRCYRFFADRGVSPNHVWLSRQLPLLVPALFILLIFVPISYFLAPEQYEHATREFVRYPVATIEFVFCSVVLGMAVGQMWSMFLRSGILAVVFGVVSNVLLALWLALMLFWRVPLWWSVLPIVIALLLATRLRTRNWLLERNTLRAWLLPGVVVLGTMAGLLAAVPYYRVHEIPNVGPVFPAEELDNRVTSEERATLDLYRDAAAAYAGAIRTQHAATRKEAFAIVVKANKQELRHPAEGVSHFLNVIRGLQWDAEAFEKSGDLDAALDRYLATLRVLGQMRRSELTGSGWSFADQWEMQTNACLMGWAGRPKQTAERLMTAERDIRKIHEAERGVQKTDPVTGLRPLRNSYNFPIGVARIQYSLLRRIIDGDTSAIVAATGRQDRPLSTLTMLWLRLPWERARALRVLNVQTYCTLRGLWGDNVQYSMGLDEIPLRRDELHRLEAAGESELVNALREQLGMPPISLYSLDSRPWIIGPILVETWRATETTRTATRIILALEAWKIKHGSLPKKLDELVGPYLDRLPNDPYSRESFRYFPEGLPSALQWKQPLASHWAADRKSVPANTAFIWSTGPKVHWTGYCSDGVRRPVAEYRIRDIDPYVDPQGGIERTPSSDDDVWSSGWPFPIP